MKIPYLLSIVTWLPAVGAVIILALFKKEQSKLIKQFTTAWFGVTFIASLFLCTYDRAAGGMQFIEDFRWIPVIGARYQMGADGVAVLLIVLTTLLGVELHSEAREGILRSTVTASDGGRWRLRFDGSVSLLPLLRGLTRSNVFSNRYMGRRE